MSGYVSEQWCDEKLQEQGGLCGICNDVIDILSIDRLDNGQGHFQYNCRIVCEVCNKSRKDAPFSVQPDVCNCGQCEDCLQIK